MQKIINSPRQVQEGLAVDLKACNEYKNGSLAASNINIPVLCILGEKDKMTPLLKGKALAEKIKNSQLEIIKDVGHMLPYEGIFQAREIIKNFIQKNNKPHKISTICPAPTVLPPSLIPVADSI